MRGAHLIDRRHHDQDRIIPADAGSTAGSGWFRPPQRGSSPRMRGALRIQMDFLPKTRIIPADAGSTPTPTRPSCRPWDHPRGCGEHDASSFILSGLAGSSPRMRGAPILGCDGLCLLRIIPADAGSTMEKQVLQSRVRDHPRGCGEHWAGYAKMYAGQGSSPRMRGARHRHRQSRCAQRIIPADAGST